MKTALSLLIATLTLGVSIAAHAGPDFQVINAARARPSGNRNSLRQLIARSLTTQA
jgi:hypothetical protein